MSWIFVNDALPKDMEGACECIHIHARAPSPRTPTREFYSSLPKPKTYTYKTLRLSDLPTDREWWADRVAQYPSINLLEELSRAQDWPGADRVKNAKIFFRNWLAKAAERQPTRDVREALSPDQIRARLSVV